MSLCCWYIKSRSLFPLIYPTHCTQCHGRRRRWLRGLYTFFTVNYWIYNSINGAPVFWKSNWQPIFAMLTVIAEYIALSACKKDVVWLCCLVHEIDNHIIWNARINIHRTIIETHRSAATAMASVPIYTKFQNTLESVIIVSGYSCIVSFWLSNIVPAQTKSKIVWQKYLHPVL